MVYNARWVSSPAARKMEGPCAATPAAELRVVQRLLWDVISERLNPAERDEVGGGGPAC